MFSPADPKSARLRALFLTQLLQPYLAQLPALVLLPLDCAVAPKGRAFSFGLGSVGRAHRGPLAPGGALGGVLGPRRWDVARQCWPQAGAEPKLLVFAGSPRRLHTSRPHIKAKRYCPVHLVETVAQVKAERVWLLAWGVKHKPLLRGRPPKSRHREESAVLFRPAWGHLSRGQPPSPPLSPVAPWPGRRGLAP